MLLLVARLVCAVEHEGRGRFSLDNGDRGPRQQQSRSGWRREAQRGRREERLDRLASMDDEAAFNAAFDAAPQFQRFATRLDRVSQERMPRGMDQEQMPPGRMPLVGGMDESDEGFDAEMDQERIPRRGRARQGRLLRGGFGRQGRTFKRQERVAERRGGQRKPRLSDGQQERQDRSAALYAALLPEPHKQTLKEGVQRRDPDAPCGAPCRDPLTPGPKFDAVERHLVTAIDDTVATLQSHVRTCPSLAELVPCVGQKGLQNDTAPCTACLPATFETTFHADKEVLFANNLQRRLHTVEGALKRGETNKTAAGGAGIMTKPVYLIVAVPPFSGSSGLEGLLSTSPAASTMCSKSIWQCEATSFLLQHKVFDYKDRWNPTATNWTRVYETYYKDVPGTVWDDPHKTILVDKSPPNLAKAKGMVEFFEKHQMDYRFVIMARHPCMYKEMTATTFSVMASFLREITRVVPARRRFTVAYTDLVTRPDKVASDLLAWLPELTSLSIDKSFLNFREARGAGMGRPDMPGTENAGVVWSPFGPLNVDIPAEQKAEQVRAAGHGVGLVSQQGSQQAGRSHGGREKPVLAYIRDMCTLRVIKREYNESDAVLPWLSSHAAQAAQ